YRLDLHSFPTRRSSDLGTCRTQRLSSRSERVDRGAGCGKSARPDLWEPRGSNPPGPPGRPAPSTLLVTSPASTASAMRTRASDRSEEHTSELQSRENLV